MIPDAGYIVEIELWNASSGSSGKGCHESSIEGKLSSIHLLLHCLAVMYKFSLIGLRMIVELRGWGVLEYGGPMCKCVQLKKLFIALSEGSNLGEMS